MTVKRGVELNLSIITDTFIAAAYTGAWADPVGERAAAEALAEQGVDVIGQHVDTPTVQIVARKKGIYGTGHHRDLSGFSAAIIAGKHIFAGPLKDRGGTLRVEEGEVLDDGDLWGTERYVEGVSR